MVNTWLPEFAPLARISMIAPPAELGLPSRLSSGVGSLPRTTILRFVGSTPCTGSLTRKLLPRMVWSAVYASVPATTQKVTATPIFLVKFFIYSLLAPVGAVAAAPDPDKAGVLPPDVVPIRHICFYCAVNTLCDRNRAETLFSTEVAGRFAPGKTGRPLPKRKTEIARRRFLPERIRRRDVSVSDPEGLQGACYRQAARHEAFTSSTLRGGRRPSREGRYGRPYRKMWRTASPGGARRGRRRPRPT